LGLRQPQILVHGFDRPNISLRVDMFSSKDAKEQSLLRRVEFADKPGIVYAATRQHAESIAADLNNIGVPALCYHGGMKSKERAEIQDKFMSGEVPVIVATCAFGMGVDKADIRFVYHADVSDSLDAYYQEIGRAGRDGEPAEAVLFFRSQDISSQQYKTGSGLVDNDALETVFNALLKHKTPMTTEELSVQTNMSGRKLAGFLHKLEEADAVKHLDSGELQIAAEQPFTAVAEAAAKQQQFQKELRKRRLQQMQAYAESRKCRRECLLRYFGDDYGGPCGNCDRCEEMGVGFAKAA